MRRLPPEKNIIMLKTLSIKNLAVVENVSLTFTTGLNVLTGSTGAGKSLILSAVNLLRGGKGGPALLRKGRSKASVEAEFHMQSPAGPGAETGLGNKIVLKREITESGRSQAFINGRPSSLKVLAAIAGRLIEPHGQNEQMQLKEPENHINYLDEFGCMGKLVLIYKQHLSSMNGIFEELRIFNAKMEMVKEKKELLEHRIEEISESGLKKGDKESVEKESAVLANCRAIADAIDEANALIYDGESSAYDALSRAGKVIDKLLEIDGSFSESVARLHSAGISISETAEDLRSYMDRLEFDPESYERAQEKLALIQKLERRYGRSLDEIIEDQNKWQEELETLDSEDERRRELQKDLDRAIERLKVSALRLSGARKECAKKLDKKISGALKKMMMGDVSFRTDICRIDDNSSPLRIEGTTIKLFDNGIDRVEFFIVTNQGEKEGSVAETASTGEASRIALALKDVVSSGKVDSVIIFDEVDAGVGGDMGDAIAGRLAALSRNYQIISITHMPQIAAAADHHLIVSKSVKGGRTAVEVLEASGKIREVELARMLGGSEGSTKRIALAVEMLGAGRKNGTKKTMRP